MKYFIDTEFIEGFHKSLFGKKRHFIDLISIGIICEDGRELYRISNEFDSRLADRWVKDNVISKLEPNYMNYKSNKEIIRDIKEFMGYKPEWTDYGSDEFTNDKNIEIYAYYADYDWVLFCSLFGRMIDLPNGMPMYCIDLKQHLDYMLYNSSINYHEDVLGELNPEKDRPATLQEKISFIKTTGKYPKQKNEHNALDDAKWNYELYKFMEGI